jgi:hypothetical protein
MADVALSQNCKSHALISAGGGVCNVNLLGGYGHNLWLSVITLPYFLDRSTVDCVKDTPTSSVHMAAKPNNETVLSRPPSRVGTRGR